MSALYQTAVSNNLSIKQQFKLKVIKDQIKDLSLEQAQAYVVESIRQMMVKDNLFKQLLSNN